MLTTEIVLYVQTNRMRTVTVFHPPFFVFLLSFHHEVPDKSQPAPQRLGKMTK